MKVVSHRLGHSSTAITSDLYTHVVPTVSRDAADRIAQAIPRRPRIALADSEYCGSTADDHHNDQEKRP